MVSCYGTSLWDGLNAHGLSVISEMNRLGMVINVAHASDEEILQVVSKSCQPVIYSHGGFRGIVNTSRNITDEAAKAIAAKGGVVGIQFVSTFNNPKYAEWKQSKRQVSISKQTVLQKDLTRLSIADVDRQVTKSLPFVYRGVIPDQYWMGTDQLAKVYVEHGGGGFWFNQAILAFNQGLFPKSFGTDEHCTCMNSGMKNMLNVMSKYLNMGMSLQDIIDRATWKPAESIKREDLGNLSVGGVADIAVLSLEYGKFSFVDSGENRIDGDRKFVGQLTIRAGKILWDLNGISAMKFTE